MRMPGPCGGKTMRPVPVAGTSRAWFEGNRGSGLTRQGELAIHGCAKEPLPRTRLPSRFATGRGLNIDIRPRLSAAVHPVFETRKLLDADRSARVQPAGGDADLARQNQIRRRRRTGSTRYAARSPNRLRAGISPPPPVFGDDRVGVMRAVAFDMGDRPVDAVDHPGGQ